MIYRPEAISAQYIADLEDIVECLRNPPEGVIEIGADECHCPIEVMKGAWSLMARRILEKQVR